MKKCQAHDYVSDNVRFNQDAKDKQDWNRYTMSCTVTKENCSRFTIIKTLASMNASVVKK